MPKKKKPYNLTRKIVVQLRAIHRGWPNSVQCLRDSKVVLLSKGSRHRCSKCEKLFRKEYMRRDHIVPIGKEPQLLDGSWVPTWDSYINSVFAPAYNYQSLCLDCHDRKTKEEKEKRSFENKTNRQRIRANKKNAPQ